MAFNWNFVLELTGSILLFCLVFGMSGTVDSRSLVKQVKNRKAIITGLVLQFVILPVLGFLVVRILNLSHAVGLTLLVVTSSPGGSYSNWWCSLFNADLALSVTMTGISTILSVVLLPVNLMLHASFAYGDNILDLISWSAVFLSLAIVMCAIGLGLYCTQRFNSQKFHLNCNRIGNVAGLMLIVFSGVMSNTYSDEQIWERDWQFYVGTALPCVGGLLIANIVSSLLLLKYPERVAVSIECCFQNVGIATSVALTMFEGEDLAEAMGVPFYYGFVESILVGLYCVGAWKAGWTKAPADASIWNVLLTSYEVIEAEQEENGSTTKVTVASEKEEVLTDSDEDEEGFHYVKHSEAQQPEESQSAYMA